MATAGMLGIMWAKWPNWRGLCVPEPLALLVQLCVPEPLALGARGLAQCLGAEGFPGFWREEVCLGTAAVRPPLMAHAQVESLQPSSQCTLFLCHLVLNECNTGVGVLPSLSQGARLLALQGATKVPGSSFVLCSKASV
eukprot:1160451-Pelagomonas_calceolata.AAC.24